MIRLDRLSPFEVYPTIPPVVMPENPSNRKKFMSYSVFAPSIESELEYINDSKMWMCKSGIYHYFFPKRYPITLYNQGNRVLTPNKEGELDTKLEDVKSKSTVRNGNLKQITKHTSYNMGVPTKIMHDLNVLVETYPIYDAVVNNPKDKRHIAYRMQSYLDQLKSYFHLIYNDQKNRIGNYQKKYLFIPLDAWTNNDTVYTNPSVFLKRINKDPLSQFLRLTLDVKTFKELDHIIILSYRQFVMVLDPNKLPDPIPDGFLFDCISRYMKRISRVRIDTEDDNDTPSVIDATGKVEEITQDEARKEDKIAGEININDKETVAEQNTEDLLNKVKVDPDRVTDKTKQQISRAITKTKEKEIKADTTPDQAPSPDVIRAESEPGTMISAEDADLILKAKMENRSVASQKRNEMLKDKYKTLKVGVIPIADVIQAEEKYEIPAQETKAHTINPALKKLTVRNMERTYNENLMQYDLVGILLHFSHVSPALYLNKDIQIEDASTPTDRLLRYRVEMEDENRKRHHLNFLMPKMYQDKYLYLNDQKMNIGHQKFPYPITKVSPSRCQLVTNYKKIFTERYGQSLSPRINSIKKVLGGAECPASVKAYRGDNTILNANTLTTVEYDELAAFFMKLDIMINRKQILRIYFSAEEAYSEIGTDHLPKKVKIMEFAEDGTSTAKMIPVDDTLFPVAMIKDTEWYYLSATNNRVYDSKGDDHGELSEFIMDSVALYDPTLSDKFGNSTTGSRFMYARSKLMDTFMPTILAASAADPGGLIAVMQKAKINYQFVERHGRVDYNVTGVVKFADGYLLYDRYPYENSLLMNGLATIPTSEYTFQEMMMRDTYVDLFDILYDNRKLIYGITNFYYLMIDPITKDVLTRLNMPTDFTTLLIYCVGTLVDNTFQIDSDYANSRIRSNEIINAYLYKALATAWEQFRSERTDTFSIPEREVIRSMLEDQLVDPHSTLNVTLEQENDSVVKLKGPSGMNEDHSFTIEKRAYHPSMRGIIAVNSIASGEVGIARHMTLNANVDDARGFVTMSKNDYDGTELASTGELLQTFVLESADMERVAMSIAQSKHVVPVASQSSSLVNYDMERVIPYISNDFSFCAKQDGTVVSLKDDIMIVQYKDGTYDDVDISKKPCKNVDGGFYVMNQMIPQVKEGSRFKKNDILAIDPNYINSNDMFGDPCANVGCLARLSIESNAGVFEDSGYMTDELAHRMSTKITQQKRVILSKYANIKYIAKVGQHVSANEPILTFDDTEDEFSSQLLASIAEEQEDDDEIIATNAPVVSKVTGTIADITMYYTIPLEEMTPSMRKIVEDYNKNVVKRAKTLSKYRSVTDSNTIIKPAEYIKPDQNGKVKGIKVGDGIVIDFYIEYLDIVAPGDKTSCFSPLKATQSFIIPQELAPYTDFNPERKIDMALACIGMYKRMCLDLIKVGGITKFLIEMKRIHRNQFADRIKEELKKMK